MVLLAVCGKPNAGKSTLMAAATGTAPQIASYPFTTIDPNKGVCFCNVQCPHVRLSVACNPNNSRCEGGTRRVPVNIVDIAGIVPGAHEGKGMGNRFLTDVAAADALLVVADASGGTDDNGNLVAPGAHDACEDVRIFLDELDDWFFEVTGRNAKKSRGTHAALEDFFQSLAGIGIPYAQARDAYAKLGLGPEPSKLSDAELRRLSKLLREKTKPFLIAANKCDSVFAKKGVEALRAAYPDAAVVPVLADYELALQRAKASGLVEYDGRKIALTEKGDQNARAAEAIRKIQGAVAAYGSTGVQDAIDKAVFSLARQVVVFPVEDETHYANHFGKVLPDAILLRQGSTPAELAAAIHADLASHFLYAVDCEKKTRIGKDHRLATGEVIKIVAAR
jgi:ribosome-binding ATPase YchF (GTP1/OBG family)